jgi:hypothetical protein
MEIIGFLVVRLPQLNYLVPGRDVTPCIGGLCYSGIDRQRWADVFDDDFYIGKAPSDISLWGNKLKTTSNDFTGIDVCQDSDMANRLLEYSNRVSASNELIAVRAPLLQPVKGLTKTNLPIAWLGYDFVRLGEWSLIAGGLFMYPQSYSGWLAQINQFGLFDDDSALANYEKAYEAAVAQGRSEPLGSADSSLGTIAVEVGRVQAA